MMQEHENCVTGLLFHTTTHMCGIMLHNCG